MSMYLSKTNSTFKEWTAEVDTFTGVHLSNISQEETELLEQLFDEGKETCAVATIFMNQDEAFM